MANTNMVTPGYKTTEFWITVGAALGGILVASVVFDASGSELLNNAIKSTCGTVTAVAALIAYIASRTKVKSKG